MTPSLGLWALGAAAIVWAGFILAAVFGGRDSNRAGWAVAFALGTLLLGIAGWVGIGEVVELLLRLPSFGLSRALFRLDPLAGWFLLVIALAGLPLAAYLPGYMQHIRERVDMRLFWASLAALLFSMAGVALAANVLTFLVAWEIMSISSFLLVATDHREQSVRSAALLYLGATRVGTAFLMAGLLWAHNITGSWVFHDWHLGGRQALGPGLLILIGLCVKAGSWPFHLWLPAAHPAAPAPVSALMSGVMVKVAVCMIVRLFALSPAFSHPVLGYTILALGAISAFWGVLFALLQHDLKRLLAYHTVENVGLILMGVGISEVTRLHGFHSIASVSLAAALFHVLNHALFKTLLFLGAGAVDAGLGTRDLERLGGLGKRMPVTFACFVVGSAAICALPPLNGFASEWLLYQSLLGAATSPTLPAIRFGSMLIIAWVTLVGALALACFVKATGVAFLGRPRTHAAEHAHEASLGMRAAQIVLAFMCVGLGLGVSLVLRILARVVAPLESGGSTVVSAWTLPVEATAVVLAVTAVVIGLWIRSAERVKPARRFITWECGFGNLTPRMQATATSFAQPIARMFGLLYRYDVTRDIKGEQRRLFPDEIHVEPVSVSFLESGVYGPALRLVNRLGGLIQKVQAGSIHLYLLTMFGTLLALLALARLAQ